ncbi:MAG: hypothetical protein IPK79_12665 [Vampirovibrionales bacterium]|nr:hypothetical protein [Vampirovibrionales bacterium]
MMVSYLAHSRWRQKLPAVLNGLSFAGVLLLCLNVQNVADLDLWGKMAIGALIDQNPGYFPYRDVFSFGVAGGRLWIDHEWGSGFLLFYLFKHWGSLSIFCFKLTLVFACIAMMLQTFRQERACHANPSAFIPDFLKYSAPLTAFVLWNGLGCTFRCHLFSFFFFTLFLNRLLAFDRVKGNSWKNTLAFLPLAMAFWVNLHAGFIMGFGLLGAFYLKSALQRNWRQANRLLLTTIACGLATWLNPYGLDLHRELFGAWGMPRPYIMEWGHVLTHSVGFGVSYLLVALFFAGVAIYSALTRPRQFPVVELMLVALAVAGTLHFKLAPFFIIAAIMLAWRLKTPPAFAWTRSNVSPENQVALRQEAPYAVKLILSTGILLLVSGVLHMQGAPLYVRVLGTTGAASQEAETQLVYPQGLVRFLQQNKIEGDLWTTFGWGQYFFWRLYPAVRVSIDGRYEAVYDDRQMQAYLAFYMPPYDLRPALRSGATLIVIPAGAAQLRKRLDRLPGWARIYSDAVATLYQRRDRLRGPYVVDGFSNRTTAMDAHLGDLSRFRLTGARRPADPEATRARPDA